MNKSYAFLILRGLSTIDNALIFKEKFIYFFSRIFSVFTKKNYFTMGEGLNSDVMAINSYGVFTCRKKSADLHIISDSYEFDVRTLFESLAKKSCLIVDVGANVGKYAILAAKTNPSSEIFAFEPSRSNFAILKKNKEINHCNNLQLMELAISKKQGTMNLYDGPGTGGFSLKVKSKNFKKVKINKLDNLFKNKTIDLIKIDTEGAELDVLNGATELINNKRIKNILVELDKKDEETIKKMMKSKGYSIKRIQYNNFLFYTDGHN